MVRGLSEKQSHHLLRSLFRKETESRSAKLHSKDHIVCNDDDDLILHPPNELECRVVQLCRGCCLGLQVAAGAIHAHGTVHTEIFIFIV